MRKIVELLSLSLFFYALSCICTVEETYLSSNRFLLLSIKIITEYHNDVYIYIYAVGIFINAKRKVLM